MKRRRREIICNVKPGDKIVQYQSNSVNPKPIRMLTVQRVTKTLAICGRQYYERLPLLDNPRPATAEEVQAAEAYFADKERNRQEAAAAQAALESALPTRAPVAQQRL